ncbi:hypothetical protein EI94DRAFT_1801277 [Lactarius quietus]|nr:hypothetical protein EI94DRAFT_1801277 [Lactarius quietus]
MPETGDGTRNSISWAFMWTIQSSSHSCRRSRTRHLKNFRHVSPLLSSSMKGVSVDVQVSGFAKNDLVGDIDEELVNLTDKRIFAISTAFHRSYSIDKIWQITNIDKWFLIKLQNIFNMEKHLFISPELLCHTKKFGFSDHQLSVCVGTNELAVHRLREEHGVSHFIKQIDTVTIKFLAFANHLYTSYNAIEHDVNFKDCGVMVFGSGVYHIASSVEFDWGAVRANCTLHEQGLPSVMVSYNPVTVNTDSDQADQLCFENIALETFLDIYDMECSHGVIHRTLPEMIDSAENRYKFSRLLDEIGIDSDQLKRKELTSFEDAEVFFQTIRFPILVPARLSSQAAEVSREYLVRISKYIEQVREIEMDTVTKDGKMIMYYISDRCPTYPWASLHSILDSPPVFAFSEAPPSTPALESTVDLVMFVKAASLHYLGASGSGGASPFESSVDPSLDPELTMDLRMSLEEEAVHQAAANPPPSLPGPVFQTPDAVYASITPTPQPPAVALVLPTPKFRLTPGGKATTGVSSSKFLC